MNNESNKERPGLNDEGRRGIPRPAILVIGTLVLVLTIGFLAVVGTTQAGEAQSDPIVRCDPVVAVGPSDEPLTVDIYIENVVELYGADVRLSFDPSIAQIVDADPNSDGTQIEILDEFLSPDFVLRRIGDNTAGTIWYAVSQVNPSPPVSGSGALGRITFQPLKAGTFDMPITYQLLATAEGNELDATVVDCRVSFIDMEAGIKNFMPVIFDAN